MKLDEENKLLSESAKGARAQAILSSAGWKQDIEPYLANREIELSKGSSWKPGGPETVDLTALGCAYNGGRQDECFNLKNKLLIWIEQGHIAQEKLEKEQKK